MDWDLIWSTICFIFSKFINLNCVFSSLNLDNFTFVTFVSSSNNDNLIILTDGNWSNTMLFTKVFWKGSGHNTMSDMRCSSEVCFSCFSSAAGDLDVSFHFMVWYILIKILNINILPIIWVQDSQEVLELVVSLQPKEDSKDGMIKSTTKDS